MTTRWLIIAPVVVALSLGTLSAVQGRIDSLREKKFEEELLYLPNEKLLNHFTAGLSSVVADLLWLKTIQYTAKEFHSIDRKYTWLEHMCNTVVRLDPNFAGAYEYGGTLLAAIGNDEAALKFLRDGIPKNPDSWQLPFEAAKVYILNRKDEPGSPALAMHYLNMTAQRHPHPETFAGWAGRLQARHSLDDVGESIWEHMRETSNDEFMVELAESKLNEIRIRRNTKKLTELALAYDEKFGCTPKSLDELIEAGFLETLPEHNVENEYLIDKHGIVTNTFVLDRDVESRRAYLNRELKFFKKDHGQFPASLDEWSKLTGESVPAHPYPTRDWTYNPASGEVR